jgi:phage terminase Nu1 subunit (DNA packaging protein)
VAKSKKSTPQWIAKTQAELARELGISLKTIQSWSLQGMPGQSGRYVCAEVIDWLRSDGPWKPHVRPALDDPDGGDTIDIGLERWRLAKAQIAELELELRKGTVLPREEVRMALGRWAIILKRCGESLAKKFGAAAAERLNDALAECDRVVRHEFGSGSANKAPDL